MNTEKPRVGQTVHYVMPDHFERAKGQVRAAMVVRTWSEPGYDRIQLQVFTDGHNDGPECASGLLWQTSIAYDESGKPGTWHWPPPPSA